MFQFVQRSDLQVDVSEERTSGRISRARTHSSVQVSHTHLRTTSSQIQSNSVYKILYYGETGENIIYYFIICHHSFNRRVSSQLLAQMGLSVTNNSHKTHACQYLYYYYYYYAELIIYSHIHFIRNTCSVTCSHKQPISRSSVHLGL